MLLVSELAERAHGLAGEALPPAVARAAEEHVVDTVGALLAGYSTLGPRLDDLVRALGLGTGAGTPGSIRRAAFVGGAYAHAWEADDIHRETVLCPGCVVLPSLLAVLDQRPEADWAHFVRSYAVGYEVALGAGLAVGSNTLLTAGWWPTALIGPLGGAAAVSVFLGRTRQQTAAAIAVAAQQAGGAIAGTVVAADTRYLLAASAAERSVTAVMTVAAGWSGPEDILDDARSPFRRAELARPAPASPLLPLMSIKPHAGPKHLQAAIDALLQLRRGGDWDVDRITGITCHLPRQLVAVVDRPAPFASALQALASAQFILASTALHGRSTPLQFGEEALKDRRVLALSPSVSVVADDELTAGYPQRWGARVEVFTTSGTMTADRAEARGDPGSELSRDELVEKFAALTASVLGLNGADLATGLLAAAAGDPPSLLRDKVLPFVQSASPRSQEVA